MVRLAVGLAVFVRVQIEQHEVARDGLFRVAREEIHFGEVLLPLFGILVPWEGVFVDARVVQAEGGVHGAPVAVGIAVPGAIAGPALQAALFVDDEVLAAFGVVLLQARDGQGVCSPIAGQLEIFKGLFPCLAGLGAVHGAEHVGLGRLRLAEGVRRAHLEGEDRHLVEVIGPELHGLAHGVVHKEGLAALGRLHLAAQGSKAAGDAHPEGSLFAGVNAIGQALYGDHQRLHAQGIEGKRTRDLVSVRALRRQGKGIAARVLRGEGAVGLARRQAAVGNASHLFFFYFIAQLRAACLKAQRHRSARGHIAVRTAEVRDMRQNGFLMRGSDRRVFSGRRFYMRGRFQLRQVLLLLLRGRGIAGLGVRVLLEAADQHARVAGIIVHVLHVFIFAEEEILIAAVAVDVLLLAADRRHGDGRLHHIQKHAAGHDERKQQAQRQPNAAAADALHFARDPILARIFH